VANKLLADQVASVQSSQQNTMDNFGGGFQGRMPGAGGGWFGRNSNAAETDYVSTITANVDVVVLLQLFGIGILLTLVSSATAVASILRYDPLKILSNRS
jgi:putative ABC transport system permease protein